MNDPIKDNPQNKNQRSNGGNPESSLDHSENNKSAYTDNRPEVAQQRALQKLINNSPQVRKQAALQTFIDNSPQVQQQAALQRKIDNSPRILEERDRIVQLFGDKVKMDSSKEEANMNEKEVLMGLNCNTISPSSTLDSEESNPPTAGGGNLIEATPIDLNANINNGYKYQVLEGRNVDGNSSKLINKLFVPGVGKAKVSLDKNAKFPQNPWKISPEKKAENALKYKTFGAIFKDIALGSKESLIWGEKVSSEFRKKVINIANDLGSDPNHLMAIMAFESGKSFSASIKNASGSGATGLIQFMPSTAKALGTTIDKMEKMTPEEQLEFVKKYFIPYKNKLNCVEDFYMAVLWPKAVGKSNDYVLFREGSKAYSQNKGLDIDKNGAITKEEAASKVINMLEAGKKFINN